MHTRNIVVVELAHVIAVAMHEPLKTIVDADDFARAGARFERDRADDAVDPGRRTAADKNAEIAVGSVMVCHGMKM